MTLALRLAQRGELVILFEESSQLGGLASVWQLGDITWDRHYHVTLLSDRFLRGLLSELGLQDDMEWVQTRTGFYSGGKLYSMSNTLEFLRFPPLGLWDKFRLGVTILHASRVKDWRALEAIPVEHWLRRWSGNRTTEKIWLPLLRAKLGENYKKASAAFLWATIARMYAARRSGMKKEMFGYVRGGYARILAALGRKLEEAGVEVRLNSRASRVESSDGGVNIFTENGGRFTVDQAVITAPASVAANLCPQLTSEEKKKLQAIEYQGIICASVMLKQPLAGYYVTNIIDDWVPFTAVIEMSALVDRSQFGGQALIYLPKYLPSNDPAFSMTDDEIRDSFISSLEKMYPGFHASDVLQFQISRVRNVFALPTLNYSQKLPSMITSVRGVSIVNSAHIVNGTLNVNETIQLAENAVTRLLSYAGRTSKAQYAGV